MMRVVAERGVAAAEELNGGVLRNDVSSYPTSWTSLNRRESSLSALVSGRFSALLPKSSVNQGLV